MGDAFAKLHYFSHVTWWREGIEGLTQGRIALLETADALLRALQAGDGVRYASLGEQAVLLEDIARLRPDLLALLVIYGAGGRLGISPFYAGVDAMLSSGETLIRDLLVGLADTQAHGLPAPKTLYLAQNTQFNAQLPQFLRGFGIDSVIVVLRSHKMPLPFRWAAPDDTDVLVFPYEAGTPQDALEAQSLSQPDGPFLWLHAFDAQASRKPHFDDGLRVPVQPSTPGEFIALLRESLPDALRPLFRGDFYTLEQAFAAGRFSARMPFKQRLDALTRELACLIEPLLTLALTQGLLPSADNARALWAYSWRLLLQSHAPAVVGGMTTDDVMAEADINLQQAEALQANLLKSLCNAWHGAPTASGDQTHLVVWNLTSRRVAGMVDVRLRLPEGKFPFELRDAQGQSVVFTWYEAKQMLNFRAECPPMGYSTFTLELRGEPTSVYHRAERSRTTMISDADKVSVALEGDHVVWQGENWRVEDLVTYYDSGDYGSVEAYRTPTSDAMLIATLTDVVYSETAPTYERLVTTHRLRVPNALEDGKRGRGFKAFEITTSATLYFNVAGLHLHTSFTNPANDHRLRLHLQMPQPIRALLMDSPYYLNARPTGQAHPLQTFVLAQLQEGEMLLAVRGIRELTTLAPSTLALTLLRAVGWLDNSFTHAVPAAQTQETFHYDYALYPNAGSSPSQWWHTAQTFQMPLYAVQADTAPAVRERSYLTLEDERALVTALKPPQVGTGWVVRLFNPHDTPLETRLHAHQPITQARWVTLQERQLADAVLQDGAVVVRLKPYQIATLWLIW